MSRVLNKSRGEQNAGVPEIIVTHGIYLQYIIVEAASAKKVKTASSECSVRVQSGTEWSDRRELTPAARRRDPAAQ